MLLSDLPSISCPMESPAHFLCENKTKTLEQMPSQSRILAQKNRLTHENPKKQQKRAQEDLTKTLKLTGNK